jgi:hypothetical protein
MNAQGFVDKWRGVVLKERSFYQEHFLDVFSLVGHQTPAECYPEENCPLSRQMTASQNMQVGLSQSVVQPLGVGH